MSTTTKKKPAPKKPAKKQPGSPGVIGSILEFLGEASARSPITKEDLVNRLAKRFPSRPKDSMAKTVNVQVPGRMSKERDVVIVKEGDGFYIEK